MGAVTVTPAENFVSPLSKSSPPRKHYKKKKLVSPHDSLAVHPSERSQTLPSSAGLCVRQIENEQQSIATVGEVSQPLKVMAQASRLAGTDNAVPSLPGSDSWLSKKKQKKSEACSCTSWCDQATFWMLSEHFGCWACHAPLTLFDCVTCAIYSRSVYATSQRHNFVCLFICLF